MNAAALARPLAYENAAALARKASANGFISYENALAVFMDSLPADLSIDRREFSWHMELARKWESHFHALMKIGARREAVEARGYFHDEIALARKYANRIRAKQRSIINRNGGINE